MHIGIYVKDPLFLSDFNETRVYSTVFGGKKIEIWNFMKIRRVGAELFHADRHDEANSLLLAILRTPLKPVS